MPSQRTKGAPPPTTSESRRTRLGASLAGRYAPAVEGPLRTIRADRGDTGAARQGAKNAEAVGCRRAAVDV